MGVPERARRWFLWVSSIGLLALFAILSVTDNGEREALERQLRLLDAQIAVERKIMADPREEELALARLTAQRAPLEQKLFFDPRTLVAQLSSVGLTSTIGPALNGGEWLRRSITVQSEGLDDLTRTARIVDGSDAIVRWRRLDVAPTGWAVDIDLYVIAPPSSQPPGSGARKSRWYSRFNRDLRERVEARQRELLQLDQKLGLLAHIPELRRRVEFLEELAASIEDRGSIRPALEPVFLHKQPVLSTGALFLDEEDAIIGEGTRGGVDRDTLEMRLSGVRTTEWLPSDEGSRIHLKLVRTPSEAPAADEVLSPPASGTPRARTHAEPGAQRNHRR